MAPFWFLAGVLTTLATLVMLLPWLRTMPRLGSLPAVPWTVAAGDALSMERIRGRREFRRRLGRGLHGARHRGVASPPREGRRRRR